MLKNININIAFAFTLLFFTLSSNSNASVIAESTRIIYLSKNVSKSFTLTNEDDFPNIVQIWIDDGDIMTQPSLAKTPFFVTPPVFRVSPHRGQTVKIIHNGDAMPTDRESIFYFNYLQVPPQSANASEEKNKITLLTRHRLKLFYRPVTIKENIAFLNEYQHFSIEKEGKDRYITASNNSGYFATYANAIIKNKHNQTEEIKFNMIPPYSSERIKIKNSDILKDQQIEVKFNLINDIGGMLAGNVIIEK